MGKKKLNYLNPPPEVNKTDVFTALVSPSDNIVVNDMIKSKTSKIYQPKKGRKFKDELYQSVANVARSIINKSSNENVFFEKFTFDMLILLMRELWKAYSPGGYEMIGDDEIEIEEEFIKWIIGRDKKLLNEIELKDFMKFIEPICLQIYENKGRSVVFENHDLYM